MAEGRFVVDRTPLTPRDIEKAKRELRETPEVVAQEIANLRKLIKSEPGLVWNDSDEFLTVFLRPCHWYSDSAFQLIKRICDFRVKNASILENLDVRTDEKYFKTTAINVLPERDQEGRRMVIIHCGALWDPDVVNVDHLFRLLYMVHLVSTLEPRTQVNGVVVIMDHKGMSMKQVKGNSTAYAMRLLTFIQHAVAMRMKAIHIVYEPMIFNMVFTLFKPFIQEKLKGRMFFHGDKMKKLHEHINPECLPEDYGGTLPKIDYGGEEWYPAMLSVEQEVKAWQNYGYEKDLKKK